jgi:hypothetical protein
MFLDELQPLAKELLQQPIAFSGGFVSGLLRLKPSDDPLKSWLEKQGNASSGGSSSSSQRPQSITID